MSNLTTLASVTWVDMLVIAIISLSTIISLVRGFIKEAISLVVWVVALIVAAKFSPILGKQFSGFIHSFEGRTVVAAIILFVLILLLGSVANFLLGQLINKTGLTGTDRVIGMVFGFLRGILLVGVIVLVINMTQFANSPVWKKSTITHQFDGVANWLADFIPKYSKELTQLVPHLNNEKV